MSINSKVQPRQKFISGLTQRMGALPKPRLSMLKIITPVGWAVIILFVLSVALYLWGHWSEAAVIALICGLSLIVGAASMLRKPQLAVHIALPQSQTVAGVPLQGTIIATNQKKRRSFPERIELPISNATVESQTNKPMLGTQLLVPPVSSGGSWEDSFIIPAQKRGVMTLGPAQFVQKDPLEIVRRSQSWQGEYKVYIRPRTVRIPFSAAGFQADVEGVATGKMSSSDVSFHTLREYVPGDDRRHVHWASSARLGKLVVRQYEENRRSFHLIVLDNDAAHWENNDFEIAVSAAASLALSGIRSSQKLAVETFSDHIGTITGGQMLNDMAGVTIETPTMDLPQKIAQLKKTYPNVSAFTLVTSEATEAAQIVKAAGRLGPSVFCSAIAVCSSEKPPRQTFGDVTVVSCEQVEDLQIYFPQEANQ